jgi:ribosomal protein L23
MKRTIISFLILILMSSFIHAAIANDCKATILDKYAKGKFLVLKKGGIPTMVEKMPGNFGTKSYSMITIKPDGEWKVKSILGVQSDSTNVLEEGALLTVTNIKVKKGVAIYTRTDKAMHYDATGRTTWVGSTKGTGTGHHANIFTFKIPGDWSCEEIAAAIEKYFDVYNSREEMDTPTEIKLGMTVEEVINILGQPKQKASIGNKIKYKYDEWKITFEHGKVVDIDF